MEAQKYTAMKSANTNYVTNLRCLDCGKLHDPNTLKYTCTCKCNSGDGILNVEYDYEAMSHSIKKSDISDSTLTGMWRYLPLLPISKFAMLPELCVGNTPLTQNRALADRLNLRSVMIKDDSRLPSGSLKDRASAMAVVHAKQLGFDTIATASTGNAAAALSCLCANFGLRAIVYVPAGAPAQKLMAIRAYGATVNTINGTYDQAFEQCAIDSKKNGWYLRNTAQNPYMTEGKKTVSYEICEQLKWSKPTSIFVSVGDGSIIGGVYKGFYDLVNLGWLDSIPRIYGVQAEGSNYMFRAWKNGLNSAVATAVRPSTTIADSLSSEIPKDRIKAINAVQESAGEFIQVNDAEILKAMSDYSLQGYLVEPAAATSLAGLLKARATGLLEESDSVVLINTGTGLKDISSIEKMLSIRSVIEINPELATA